MRNFWGSGSGIWNAAAAAAGCHGDCVSVAAGCQVCDDVIMISTGVADPISISFLTFEYFNSSQNTTNAVDQAALVAIWKGLTNSVGSLDRKLAPPAAPASAPPSAASLPHLHPLLKCPSI